MTVVTTAPTFEHHREPLGIGETRPRLSWTNHATVDQVAYELVRRGPDGEVTTGRVDSAEQVLVAWPFAALRSRARVEVRVRVWLVDGSAPEAWSEWSPVERGLDREDWSARAIRAPWAEDPNSDRRPPLFRRAFELPLDVVRARVHVTAHGLYELAINGRRVGRDELAPGWTTYDERLRVSTHDVSHLLQRGRNVIGAWTADGWFRGRLGFHGGHRNLWGSELTLMAQLEVQLADGSVVVVTSDDEWRAAYGPILFTGLYEGEHFDARLASTFTDPGFDDSAWEPVTSRPAPVHTFEAPTGPPVRVTQELRPRAVLRSPSGKTILDFGQNFAGRLRIRVRGEAGTTVVLRHAEVLQQGEIYTRPLRGAAATDRFTLAGGGVEEWEPRFTIHGFRYAEIEGWPGALDPDDVVAHVLHTDMRRTGWFESSDEDLNRLHENVVWSMRSNFVDVPTDCPQRDERLGWTGDIQVFAPTASFLFDCSGMLQSWLRDVAVEQRRYGTVPWYVPVIPGDEWTPPRPAAVWGDVAVLTPWTLYQRFADLELLRTQYESAKAWVDQVAALAGPSRIWDEGMQLGDWLDPAAPPDDPADASTDRYLVATAYFAWSTQHLAKSAAVLGLASEASHYGELASEVRAAFRGRYVLRGGRLTSDAQTAYALAICFDLYEDAAGAADAGDRLAQLVTEAGNTIATGFAGTPVLTEALASTGHLDKAYDVLLERECPSWLYTVLSGGTTIWERWDSLRPDGSVNPGGMTSFNHYALGAVADWLHRTVAGLAPLEPGYRTIEFAPRPGGSITSASARHLTPYGPASIGWRIVDGRLHTEVTVPSGARAVVSLPGRSREQVGAGVHHFDVGLELPSLAASASVTPGSSVTDES